MPHEDFILPYYYYRLTTAEIIRIVVEVIFGKGGERMSIFGRWFGKRARVSHGRLPETDAAPEKALANRYSGALQQDLGNAIAHQNAGQLTEAEHIYMNVLAVTPRDFNALHLLGVLYHQRGEHERAAAQIQEALLVNPTDAIAYSNLGECKRALSDYREAQNCYEKAMSLMPDWATPHFNLGNLYRSQKKFDAARTCFEKAISLEPEMVEANYELGKLLEQDGSGHGAKLCYEKVVKISPRHKLCHFSLGNLLRTLGDNELAEQHLNKVLELDKACVPALINLGNMLNERAACSEARVLLQDAVTLSPESFEAHLSLGLVLRKLLLFDAALVHFESAHKLRPKSTDAMMELGNVRVDRGEHQLAVKYYETVANANPGDLRAQWASAIATLAPFYATEGEVTKARSAFSDRMRRLDSLLGPEASKRASEFVGGLQPFLLAYHNYPNRDLLAIYGRICTRLMAEWLNAQGVLRPASAERKSEGRISLGIVSAHISDHSVWNAIVKGFVSNFDRSKFRLEIFYLGDHVDHETRYAMGVVDSFEFGVRSLPQWANLVSSRGLDALIYPEIGMDATTLRMASMRLAPLQLAWWGHPETTGLPTMDYYLTADYLEPPDAVDNYTERLVKLPNLGCHVGSSEIADVDPMLPEMGVDVTVPVFLCPGVPFKYSPGDDIVFVEIAKRVKRCKFVFFTYRRANLSMRLRERFGAAFTRAGLDANNYFVFLPWQNRDMFYGIMRRADVFLDTIGFSGFNTAMQGIECGLPIVTREGLFMRGRLASGPLKKMGMLELIAQSNEDYVEIAARLASDRPYRDDIRRRMMRERSVLFNDLAPVRALEEFLDSVVQKS